MPRFHRLVFGMLTGAMVVLAAGDGLAQRLRYPPFNCGPTIRRKTGPVYYTPGDRVPQNTPAYQRGALGERPNIIIVMADDLGYGDLGCHGNRFVRTPAIDMFYKESARLTSFHVDPTSAPTRAALLTGRYSARTGVWHDMMGRSLLRKDEKTIADIFNKAGYRTAIFGKWHLGDHFPYRACDRGFYQSLVHGGGNIGHTNDYWGNTHFNPVLAHNGKLVRTEGYCTDVFFGAAMQFIRAHRGQKFLICITPNVPQAPYVAPPQYREDYVKRGINMSLASFYGVITNLDENFGQLLNLLQEQGLAQNTIVIFTSDNGGRGQGFANTADRMRGTMGTAYEGGHRVPCFIRWPNKLKADFDIEELTAHIDIIPTLLQFCDFRLPRDVRLDGRGMLPLLVDNDTWGPRTLFIQSQCLEKPQQWRNALVMTEKYRLVKGRELYDLHEDRRQLYNLGPENPDVVKRLRFEYEEWYKVVSERFGEVPRIIIGSEEQNPMQLSCFDWHGPVVPWHQQDVVKRISANGYWALNVAREGHYQLTLRERPRVAKHPLPAGALARIRAGGRVRTKMIPPGAIGVTFDLNLDPGDLNLEAVISENQGKGPTRGAYYIEVRYAGPAMKGPPKTTKPKDDKKAPPRRHTKQPGAYD